jgi:hypothetical protein
MTDDGVGEAARRYRAGDSLAKVASAFDVDAATIRRASPDRRHHPASSRLELTPSLRRPHRTPAVSTRSGGEDRQNWAGAETGMSWSEAPWAPDREPEGGGARVSSVAPSTTSTTTWYAAGGAAAAR